MSGGHFNYAQSHMTHIKDEIESHIEEHGHDYNPEVIEEFEKAIAQLEYTYQLVRHIDRHICGDTGDESFLENVKALKL